MICNSTSSASFSLPKHLHILPAQCPRRCSQSVFLFCLFISYFLFVLYQITQIPIEQWKENIANTHIISHYTNKNNIFILFEIDLSSHISNALSILLKLWTVTLRILKHSSNTSRITNLTLTTYKTELLWCATARRQHQLLPRTALRIGPDDITPTTTVRDLGIFIDAILSMRSHVQRSVAGCFAVLRQLRSIRRSVPSSVYHTGRCSRADEAGLWQRYTGWSSSQPA